MVLSVSTQNQKKKIRNSIVTVISDHEVLNLKLLKKYKIILSTISISISVAKILLNICLCVPNKEK